MSMTKEEHARACVVIATAVLHGDFASSVSMVDEVLADRGDTHAIIAGMVGFFRGCTMEIAALTGETHQEVEQRLLQKAGATIARELP